MNNLCVLGSEGDLFSMMLIKELQKLSVQFDVCWFSAPSPKRTFRHGRFIGMSLWSFLFWEDYIKQVLFGYSRIQQEIVRDYFPFEYNHSQNDIVVRFDSLKSCKDFIYSNKYSHVLIGGVPILPQSFFENDDVIIWGCHPAPLPQVRGEDHLVFTLLYGLQPSVSIYRLNNLIDGGYLYQVYPLDEITCSDSFYSIMMKLEVFRAKTLAKFSLELLKGNRHYSVVRIEGPLHQYKDVSNKIRRKAECNLQKLLKRKKNETTRQ
jgi:hypothetical protein